MAYLKAILPFKQWSFCIILIVLLMQCNSTKTENGDTRSQSIKEQTLQDIAQLRNDLPPASLVPFALQSIKAPFDKLHTNPLSKTASYLDDFDKTALNMGVCASDISYLAAYGQEEDCIAYLENAHRMAEVLGDTALYDPIQIDAFKGHIQNQDKAAISMLLTKLFAETNDQMEHEPNLVVAGLALTGAFVEGLYQAVITIEKYDNSASSIRLLEPLVRIVLDERKALQDLIKLLEDLPYDDTIAEMRLELSILEKLYEADLQDIRSKMDSDPQFIVSKSMMRDITDEVKRIRGMIVE